MTVIMKIDLVGPERRGFAMGLNEAAGYLGVATTALATGAILVVIITIFPSLCTWLPDVLIGATKK